MTAFNDSDMEGNPKGKKKETMAAFTDVDNDGDPTNMKKEVDKEKGSQSNKIDWPINQETQHIFNNEQVEMNKTDLIPVYKKELICDHGYRFDKRCPKEMGNIQSTKVMYYDTEFIQHKARRAYTFIEFTIIICYLFMYQNCKLYCIQIACSQ